MNDYHPPQEPNIEWLPAPEPETPFETRVEDTLLEAGVAPSQAVEVTAALVGMAEVESIRLAAHSIRAIALKLGQTAVGIVFRQAVGIDTESLRDASEKAGVSHQVLARRIEDIKGRLGLN